MTTIDIFVVRSLIGFIAGSLFAAVLYCNDGFSFCTDKKAKKQTTKFITLTKLTTSDYDAKSIPVTIDVNKIQFLYPWEGTSGRTYMVVSTSSIVVHESYEEVLKRIKEVSL